MARREQEEPDRRPSNPAVDALSHEMSAAIASYREETGIKAAVTAVLGEGKQNANATALGVAW